MYISNEEVAELQKAADEIEFKPFRKGKSYTEEEYYKNVTNLFLKIVAKNKLHSSIFFRPYAENPMPDREENKLLMDKTDTEIRGLIKQLCERLAPCV